MLVQSCQPIRKHILAKREFLNFFKHFRGNLTRILLEEIRKSTIEMIEEQEAICGHLFTIQDVMVRAWFADNFLYSDFKVIRVKWSPTAGKRILLEGIRKTAREMIEEQEAVCGCLFTIQDVMVRAWLQEIKSGGATVHNTTKQSSNGTYKECKCKRQADESSTDAL
ncbi:hypothetical protein BUALT_Bualt03G0032600 [Buddleja alternifolia]|uniref:Uncharacterized protein n=1 Tax=Buddleja alternifolia TaxID=168488 RepID=A0AAV6XV62_9LAMI|nr:hypothetical protein BUALT_Bualt03G0032600 [Buddleja alternifolia]